MRYYIADCHFFHAKLNMRMDERGFADVNAMNDYMIEQWNGRVRKNDEVVILGDLSWGNVVQTNELLSKLKGRLYLVRGNHDNFLNNKNFDKSRFVWIKDYAELQDNKRKLVLSHYPILCYNYQYRRDKSGEPIGYMLHGHVHDTMDQCLLEEYVRIARQTRYTDRDGCEKNLACNLLNCFCMYSDYVPWTLDEWIEYYNKK